MLLKIGKRLLLLPGFLMIYIAVQGQVIFSEDFNGPTLPFGWSLIDNDGFVPAAAVAYVTSAWVVRTDSATLDSMMVSTSWYTPAGTSDDWLITPSILLTTNNTLNWQGRTPDAAYPDGYEVRISTTTPTVAGFLANAPLMTVAAEAQVWTDHSVNLDAAGYSSTNAYIAFRNTSTDQFLLFIDNVTIEELSGPDAELTSITIPTEYVQIPLPQVVAMPLEGVVTNIGVGTLTAVTVTVNIDQNGTPITTMSGSTPTLAAAASATINAGTYAIPDTGFWTFEYIVSVTEADGNTTNDSLFYSVIIDDSVYGRDLGTVDASLGFNGGTGSLTQNFDIIVTDDLTSVSFFVNSPTLGDQTQLEVWSVSADTPLTLIATSTPYTFTLADTGGNFITVPFATPVTLAPGEYSVGIAQLDTNNITLGGSDGRWFPDNMYFNGGGGWTPLEVAGFFNAWIIRANFGGTSCPAISVSIFTNSTTCGEANGSATAVATGSTGFTYAWSSGATGTTASGLVAGVYTVTVTDGAGCTKIGSATIGSSTGAAASITSTIDATCGLTNGTATASGGATYAWSSGATTATAAGLAPGSYTVTVTDGAGCIDAATATIGSVSSIAVSVTGENATCGDANGSATAVASGGTPTYSFLWSNGDETPTATGLTAGTYVVTIADVAGCTTTNSVVLVDIPGPTGITFLADSTLCGDSTGTATASAIGGNSPYNYEWINGQTAATATGLRQGDYKVTITDTYDCLISGWVTIEALADNIPPTISSCSTSSSTTILPNDPGSCCATISSTPYDITDNCDPLPHWVSGYEPPANNCVIDTEMVIKATDESGNVSLCTLSYIVIDIEPPKITCPQPITQVASPGSISAFVSIPSPSSFDNCQIATKENSLTGTSDPSGLFSGSSSISFTVYDSAGNSASCTTSITVIPGPSVPSLIPEIQCNEDTLFLPINLDGVASLTPDQISTFPEPDCNTASMSLSNETFICADTGFHIVTLYLISFPHPAISDTSTCMAYVQVVDTFPPVTFCKDTSIELSPSTFEAFLSAEDLDDGSFDNCFLDTFRIDRDYFSCIDTGLNLVTLTAEDESGNIDSCTSNVNVLLPSGVPFPNPEVSFECGPSNINLDTGAGFSSYLWSNGDTTQVISPVVPGIYDVTVDNGFGCQATESIVVNHIPPPTLTYSSGGDTIFSSSADSWQWLLDGIPIPGATSNFIIPATSGSYSVISTYTYSSSFETKSCPYTSNILLGVDANLFQSFQMYPNPTATEVVFEGSLFSSSQINIKIFDLMGHEMIQFESQGAVTKFKIPIDVRDLSVGIYVAILYSQKGERVEKLEIYR